MTEQAPEKDRFMLYVAAVAVAAIGTLLAVKASENEKFEPIKNQVQEENRLMNIRVLN